MSSEDYSDPLYRECIPVKITPPPPTTDGPTAQWALAHPDEPLELPTPRHLRAVGE